MGILDQIKKALELLEAAKEDIDDWVKTVNEEENSENFNTTDSEDLIAEIESFLHEVGY